MISYHFYAVPAADETPEIQQHTSFDQADRFLDDRALYRGDPASGCRPPPRPIRMSLASSPPAISDKARPATSFSQYQIPIGIWRVATMRISLAN